MGSYDDLERIVIKKYYRKNYLNLFRTRLNIAYLFYIFVKSFSKDYIFSSLIT